MTTRPERRVRAAAWLALAGLGLTTWSVLDPTPWTVVLALSVGQACGTASLVLFGLAIWTGPGPTPGPAPAARADETMRGPRREPG